MIDILETDFERRHLPKRFPLRSTVWSYLDLWSCDGTLARIHERLYLALREAAGREASSSAAIIDSQSVKSAEKEGRGAIRSAATPARRPNHILSGVLGLTPRSVAHPPGSRIATGAPSFSISARSGAFPSQAVFADRGHQGPKAEAALSRIGDLKLEILRSDPGQKGFAVLPKRWIALRTLSWIRRNRRLARDLEHLARMAEACIRLASIKMMARPSRNP